MTTEIADGLMMKQTYTKDLLKLYSDGGSNSLSHQAKAKAKSSNKDLTKEQRKMAAR